MVKPNYRYEKYRRDLAKKKKQEEKRQRKLAKRNIQSKEGPDQSSDDGENK